MRLGRRDVLLGGALVTAACRSPRVAAPETKRSADVLGRALDSAKRLGASYADARVVKRRFEHLATREDHVTEVGYRESYGLGVRVLVEGAWGFAADPSVDEQGCDRAVKAAIAIARANAGARERPVVLAPVGTYRDHWETAVEIDPFTVPLADKAELLRAIWEQARGAKVSFCNGFAQATGEEKTFASTEGSLISQSITRVAAGYTLTAIDPKTGDAVTRAHELAAKQAGWEHVARSSLRSDAKKMAEDVTNKLAGKSVTTGRRDLVLAPSHLWLTIHESVGHPTELDRALGFEANFAGTSFATTDKLGKLSYAAPHVTLYADKTTPGGLATCGYDDDGEKTQRWDLVKDGLFVGYQTTRDQASWIGEARSRGTSYAQDYRSVAFQRMPNVSLAPSQEKRSLADIIAATDDGILITGDGSWSIDHQRYNFQFGGQMFYEIKGGKLTNVLRDVAYQANTLDFWHACDLVGDASTWEMHGAMEDGKGEPTQLNPVSHGCPPARFRNVSVLNTKAKS